MSALTTIPRGSKPLRTVQGWFAHKGVLLTVFALAVGCSFVEFESSPYAPINVDVVYSAQEDLSFLSWRLDRRADPGSVVFELDVGGGPRAIDLRDAPFPAEPYECRDAWCFQYQVDGRIELDSHVPTVRARHARFGVFAGEQPRTHEAENTFDVDPLAVDRNQRIDPRRYDWFEEAGVPLVRDYAFRVRSGRCEDGAARGGLVRSEGLLDAAPGWTDADACFDAAPIRRDRQGVLVSHPLVASAETYLAQRESYTVRDLAHRTLYGVLFDLAIADPSRCAGTRERITDALRTSIEADDPSAGWIGSFEPDDASNCASRVPERYPIAAMLAAAYDLSTTLEAPAHTVLWIYVSNRPTSPALARDALAELRSGSAETEPSPPHLVEIVIAPSGGPSDAVLAYRPIEDPTLFADIASLVAETIPFRTMRHDASVEIPIVAASAAPVRTAAKLCQAVPAGATMVFPDGTAALGEAFAWPTGDAVTYRVDLGSQLGVPDGRYIDTTSAVLLEVCARFCEGPARTANGADLDSWSASPACVGVP